MMLSNTLKPLYDNALRSATTQRQSPFVGEPRSFFLLLCINNAKQLRGYNLACLRNSSGIVRLTWDLPSNTDPTSPLWKVTLPM